MSFSVFKYFLRENTFPYVYHQHIYPQHSCHKYIVCYELVLRYKSSKLLKAKCVLRSGHYDFEFTLAFFLFFSCCWSRTHFLTEEKVSKLLMSFLCKKKSFGDRALGIVIPFFIIEEQMSAFWQYFIYLHSFIFNNLKVQTYVKYHHLKLSSQ